MNKRAIAIILIAVLALTAFGRLIVVLAPKELFANSKLVFIGKVKSVRPSGIRTKLSYIPLQKAMFEWLIADVEVQENLKGVAKGQTIEVAMLSVDEVQLEQISVNPPSMIEPTEGLLGLFCLVPTPITNLFAALTAPYDEDLSVLVSHRVTPVKYHYAMDFMKDDLLTSDQRFNLIRRLTDGSGKIMPETVAVVRTTYRKELKTPSTRTNYLEWQTYTNGSGWQSDVPKGFK